MSHRYIVKVLYKDKGKQMYEYYEVETETDIKYEIFDKTEYQFKRRHPDIDINDMTTCGTHALDGPHKEDREKVINDFYQLKDYIEKSQY